jgi:hypothetical protein
VVFENVRSDIETREEDADKQYESHNSNSTQMAKTYSHTHMHTHVVLWGIPSDIKTPESGCQAARAHPYHHPNFGASW